MIDIMLKTIKKYGMIKRGDGVVVGLSGGADSSSLLYALNSIKDTLNVSVYAVHVNHSLRGEAALADQEFAKRLCRSLGIKCLIFTYDVDKISKEKKISHELAGRFVRYNAYEKACKKLSATKVALGHNMNDQAETFLMRMARGSGISGLSSIPYTRGYVIRPLLDCKREHIEKYCDDNNIKYITDHTNNMDIYTRNKVRNKLIPWIKDELNENIIETLSRAAVLFYEEDKYLDKEADKVLADSTMQDLEGLIYLDLSKLKIHNDVIIRRIIRLLYNKINHSGKDLSYKNVDSVLSLIKEGKTGKEIQLPKNISVKSEYGRLKIYRPDNVLDKGFNYSIIIGEKIFVKELALYVYATLDEKKLINSDKICTKAFDYDKIYSNLEIRNRRQGDIVAIGALNNSKKIKDYFIDEKIPKDNRDQIPLIVCKKDVLWIVGKRVSSYYEINEDTSKVLFIQLWEDK